MCSRPACCRLNCSACMWDLLVTAVMHYCRPRKAEVEPDDVARERARQEMQDSMEAGHNSLREYARLMEAYDFPNNMFTSNLHLVVCR